MTTYVYTVMVQNHGDLTMADVSAIYDDTASDVKESARDRAAEFAVHFRFQKDTPDLPDIREGAEIWVIWTVDGIMMSNHAQGGFIMKSRGTLVGDTHHIHCTCSTYNILLTRRCFKGWPTGNDATGIPTGGIEPGYSVAEWLVSNGGLTDGASGIIRAMLPNLDYSGVASVFDTLIFTADGRPGTSDPDFPYIGQWSFKTVDAVVQDIAGAVRKRWSAIRPVYWIEATTDGTSVIPKFIFRDDADTSGTLAGRFALTAAPGDFRFE